MHPKSSRVRRKSAKYRPVRSLRSFKATDFGTNRKRIEDQLTTLVASVTNQEEKAQGRTTITELYVDKCKKLQFIHTVNGDASKTAKIIKRQC